MPREIERISESIEWLNLLEVSNGGIEAKLTAQLVEVMKCIKKMMGEIDMCKKMNFN
jgi:hypothetical protein